MIWGRESAMCVFSSKKNETSVCIKQAESKEREERDDLLRIRLRFFSLLYLAPQRVYITLAKSTLLHTAVNPN